MTKNNSKQSARKAKMLGKVNKTMIASAIALTSLTPSFAFNMEEAHAAFSGGLGTESNPYIITSASQLAELNDYVTGYFKLANDIDFEYMPVTVIGTEALPFKGVLDGNGHKLKNFNIDSATAESTALFGHTDGATFKNLVVENANVTNTKGNVGVLVGYAFNTSFYDVEIRNSSAEMVGTTVDTGVGLLVGEFAGNNKVPTEVKNIKVQGKAKGKYCVGGVFGKHRVTSSHTTSIDGIYVDADLSAFGSGTNGYPPSVGGVMGRASGSNTPSTSSFPIKNVIVKGSITSNNNAGGVVGHTSSKIDMDNIIVQATLRGQTNSGTIWLGGIVGNDGNGVRKGLFVSSPLMEIDAVSKYASVIVGSKISSSNLSYINPKYIETITLKGGVRRDNESGATFSTYSQEQSVQKATYAQAGFDFKNTWGIYEGRTEPFLLFAMTDSEREEWEKENPPVDIYADARLAVEKAERTQLQSDVDIAQALITPLPSGTEKTELQNRLNAVQDAINKAKALAEATKAVEKAEATRTRTDFNTAQAKVTALPNSSEKTALQNRLNALLGIIEGIEADEQALANATKAVEKAETTRLDSDINYAQNLVTALKPSTAKDALQARLDALRKSIEEEKENNDALAKATKAVEKAEATRLDTDIDYAQDLVTALKPSSAKNALQARLDALRKSIEQENDEALAKATKAVEKAEATRLDADIDYAQGLVTALKPSTAKDALQARLDALRKSVEEEKEHDEALARATKAVEKAEATRQMSDIDYAQGLVTALKPSPAKNALQARLDALRNSIEEENTDNEALAEATRAVVKAEGTRLDADIDYAQKLVTALKPSTAKDALQARLDALRQSIKEEKEYNEALAKATRAVEKAEKTHVDADINYAQDLVTALKPSKEKDALQARLDALRKLVEEEKQQDEALAKATKAVEKAEATRQMSDVDYAQDLVTALKPSTAKDALQARLDALRKSIEAEGTDNEALLRATQAVVKAESTRLDTDIDIAQGLVTALKPSKEKDALQARLDALRKSIEQEKKDKEAVKEAEKAVEKAEDTLKQEDKDTAQDLVNKLPNGKDKDNLQDRLDKVQEQIDKAKSDKEALKNATRAVEKAEATLSQTDIDTAQRLVTALKPSKEKDALQARLDALQHLVNKLNSEGEALARATQAVVKAESTRVQADVDTARELVFKLPNSNEKDALYNRLDALQKSIDKEKADKEALEKATKAVEVAESTKMQKDVNTAQNLVTDLSGSEAKYKLQQRIDAISPVIQIDEDGTVTATFKSPKMDKLVVETGDLKIELANEYQNASKVKVVWKTVAGNKRQLLVVADGKEVDSFKKPTKVSVKLPKAYLVREVADGGLRAVLYKYQQGRYEFETNIAKDVYMFTTKQRSFKDTDGVSSQPEINELASRYVIYGTSPTTYAPTQDITRGQFSALIARSLGLRINKPTTFNDMEGHWASGEVQALKDIGIVQGKDADTFDPNATLTHSQTALIISRLLEYLGSNVPLNNPTFHDNSEISDEAWKAVGQLQSAGIFTGKGNKFEPNVNLTRAEMAKVLYNTLDVAGYMSDKKTK